MTEIGTPTIRGVRVRVKICHAIGSPPSISQPSDHSEAALAKLLFWTICKPQREETSTAGITGRDGYEIVEETAVARLEVKGRRSAGTSPRSQAEWPAPFGSPAGPRRRQIKTIAGKGLQAVGREAGAIRTGWIEGLFPIANFGEIAAERPFLPSASS